MLTGKVEGDWSPEEHDAKVKKVILWTIFWTLLVVYVGYNLYESRYCAQWSQDFASERLNIDVSPNSEASTSKDDINTLQGLDQACKDNHWIF